jgi:hypothetical protein
MFILEIGYTLLSSNNERIPFDRSEGKVLVNLAILVSNKSLLCLF